MITIDMIQVFIDILLMFWLYVSGAFVSVAMMCSVLDKVQPYPAWSIRTKGSIKYIL